MTNAPAIPAAGRAPRRTHADTLLLALAALAVAILAAEAWVILRAASTFDALAPLYVT
jgi:hypothetical protein